MIRLHQLRSHTKNGLQGKLCSLCNVFIPGVHVSRQGCTSPLSQIVETPQPRSSHREGLKKNEPENPAWLSDLTFLVTHFDRPEHLARCIKSIRDKYPLAKIVVGDNSKQARPEVPEGVTLHLAEPDCGLSRLRNELVALAETKFVMICEEDFLFTEDTDVGRLVHVLNASPKTGVVAGSLWTEGRLHCWAKVIRTADDRTVHLFNQSGPYNVTIDGWVWQPVDVVLNFFVMRKQVGVDCTWHDEIKIGGEHYRWFAKLKETTNWQVAHVPSVTAIHDKSDRSHHYIQHRHRSDWKLTAKDVRHTQPQVQGRPNIVILGVGHSGTTILSKMLSALGWQVNNNDEKYYEDAMARNKNASMLSGRATDLVSYLQTMGKPWVIKDPRMVVTLPHWIGPFAYTAATSHGPPLLIHITRDYDEVVKSYLRRGERPERSHGGYTVKELHDLAERRFEEWPWAKVKIEYENLGSAAALFQRVKHASEDDIKLPPTLEKNPCPHRGEQVTSLGCCGAPVVDVYECKVRDFCALQPIVGGEFREKPIALCIGCSENPLSRERAGISGK